MLSFGSRLKLCRKLEGLTRQQLADGVETHLATIGRWERDEDIPSFKMGCRLARFLNKDALFLGGLTDDPQPGTQLSKMEGDLVQSFRQMTPAHQREWTAFALDCHKLRQIESKAKSG
jgi:transcriptional regulator with XRE-family HTH domain